LGAQFIRSVADGYTNSRPAQSEGNLPPDASRGAGYQGHSVPQRQPTTP
jgi:hypothetical protein